MGGLLIPTLVGAGAGIAAGAALRKPKAIKPPALPTVEAPTVPELATETAEAGEAERKAARRRRGRRETVITGELEPVTAKKTLLG